MKRRSFLIGTGSTAIGGSALLGSGAFTRIESQRRVKIQVANDRDAYLGLDGCPDSPNRSYTGFDGSGHLAIEMSPDNPTGAGGQGVNSDSRTWFHRVFQVCNQGKQESHIWIQDDENWPQVDDDAFPDEDYSAYDGDRRVDFYVEDDPDQSIIGAENPVALGIGECVCIGVRTNTKGLQEGDQLLEDLDDEIVIEADADPDVVVDPDEAFFELGDLDAPDTVEPGEEFDVSVDVTNTGGEEGTQDIILYYDLVEIGRIEVTLEPSESTTVTFEDVSIPDDGDYALVVTSDDDSVSQPITVADEPVADDGVPMGTSCNYTVLAKSGISTVPDSDITGDIGVSPIASTAITGFGLVKDASSQFATSDQVDGRVFAADYNEPTPAIMSTAVSDMEAAYTDAAGRDPDFVDEFGGQLGGETLTPGVYRWNSDVIIAGDDLTLQGDSDDVWIFQITGNLTMEANLSVELSGGAQVENIFWQVAGGAGVEIGANATFAGIVMTQTGINVLTDATVDGKLLAQTDVNLDMATVSGLGT